MTIQCSFSISIGQFEVVGRVQVVEKWKGSLSRRIKDSLHLHSGCAPILPYSTPPCSVNASLYSLIAPLGSADALLILPNFAPLLPRRSL